MAASSEDVKSLCVPAYDGAFSDGLGWEVTAIMKETRNCRRPSRRTTGQSEKSRRPFLRSTTMCCSISGSRPGSAEGAKAR